MENGSLKQNLDATTATLNASRNESYKASTNGIGTNVLKVVAIHYSELNLKSILSLCFVASYVCFGNASYYFTFFIFFIYYEMILVQFLFLLFGHDNTMHKLW